MVPFWNIECWLMRICFNFLWIGHFVKLCFSSFQSRLGRNFDRDSASLCQVHLPPRVSLAVSLSVRSHLVSQGHHLLANVRNADICMEKGTFPALCSSLMLSLLPQTINSCHAQQECDNACVVSFWDESNSFLTGHWLLLSINDTQLLHTHYKTALLPWLVAGLTSWVLALSPQRMKLVLRKQQKTVRLDILWENKDFIYSVLI